MIPPTNIYPPNFQPIPARKPTNPCWRIWSAPGILLGILLLFLGICMIPMEVSRILRGSLNRGDFGSYFLYPNYNHQLNVALQNNEQIAAFLPDAAQQLQPIESIYLLRNRGVVPFEDLVGSVGNFPTQFVYLWPWSHASFFLMFMTIVTGALGILSGRRRSYSSIFAFFVMSLLTFMFSIFIIASYAVQIYWQLNKNENRRNSFASSRLDYALSSVMIALTVATTVLSFISTIVSALALALCCSRKGRYEREPLLAAEQSGIPIVMPVGNF